MTSFRIYIVTDSQHQMHLSFNTIGSLRYVAVHDARRTYDIFPINIFHRIYQNNAESSCGTLNEPTNRLLAFNFHSILLKAETTIMAITVTSLKLLCTNKTQLISK